MTNSYFVNFFYNQIHSLYTNLSIYYVNTLVLNPLDLD